MYKNKNENLDGKNQIKFSMKNSNVIIQRCFISPHL